MGETCLGRPSPSALTYWRRARARPRIPYLIYTAEELEHRRASIPVIGTSTSTDGGYRSVRLCTADAGRPRSNLAYAGAFDGNGHDDLASDNQGVDTLGLFGQFVGADQGPRGLMSTSIGDGACWPLLWCSRGLGLTATARALVLWVECDYRRRAGGGQQGRRDSMLQHGGSGNALGRRAGGAGSTMVL